MMKEKDPTCRSGCEGGGGGQDGRVCEKVGGGQRVGLLRQFYLLCFFMLLLCVNFPQQTYYFII